MTERERILKEMATAIGRALNPDEADDYDWDATPEYLEAADAALSVVEAPVKTTEQVIKPCNCGHNGYGQHKEWCTILP